MFKEIILLNLSTYYQNMQIIKICKRKATFWTVTPYWSLEHAKWSSLKLVFLPFIDITHLKPGRIVLYFPQVCHHLVNNLPLWGKYGVVPKEILWQHKLGIMIGQPISYSRSRSYGILFNVFRILSSSSRSLW